MSWPLVFYAFFVVAMVGGMVATSFVLGERHRDRQTAEPYESGLKSTGSAWMRYAAKFTLVGVFFVLFDLEAVFLYAWAIAARQLGWTGWIEVVVFASVLLVALLYLSRNGALDWGPKGRFRTSKPTEEGS